MELHHVRRMEQAMLTAKPSN